VLAAVAVIAWVLRDRWVPVVFGTRGSQTASWSPITPQGGKEAESTLESLGRKSGPVFVNLTAAQLAALFVQNGNGPFPPSVKHPEAAVVGDQVHVRATVALDEIKGLDALGPFGTLMNKEEKFELGGTLEIMSPGVAQLRVESAQIGELPIPKAAIPKLLDRLGPAERPAGVAPNGVVFRVPSYIGDVRISKGKVTVYKNVS
jgi:hypothetical protein